MARGYAGNGGRTRMGLTPRPIQDFAVPMPLRRSIALRASIAVAVTLGSTAAAAEDTAAPAPAAPAASKLHFNVDLLAGAVLRLGSFESIASRGGGMAGFSVLVGHKPWYSAGLGYERTFFGREQPDMGVATFSQVH